MYSVVSTYDLNRFVAAQQSTYAQALAEIRNGRKVSHWMWFIFPQLAGLGYSETARYYALQNAAEAQLYFQHELLGPRLVEISTVLLAHANKTALQIFGSPDDLKLRSCMTLFSAIASTDPVFEAVLARYFGGLPDPKTLDLLSQ